MPALYKYYRKCGTVVRSRTDDVWYYEVTNFTAIQESVIPFFKRLWRFCLQRIMAIFGWPMRIARFDFRKEAFAERIVPFFEKHSVEIRKTMNDGGAGRRKFSAAEILSQVMPWKILRD